MKKQWMRSMMGAMALLACGLMFVGCEDEDSDQDISATRFYIQRELTSYDGTDVYDWDTTLSQAQFEIRIKDFRAGDAAVLVYDAAGKQVLHTVLVTANYTIYVGDNELVRIGQTGSGKAGVWKVELVYNQFTGEQQVTMQ
jgi:hypothetical protein